MQTYHFSFDRGPYRWPEFSARFEVRTHLGLHGSCAIMLQRSRRFRMSARIARHKAWRLAIAIGFAVGMAAAAHGQGAADFYRNKQVRLISGHPVGGDY